MNLKDKLNLINLDILSAKKKAGLNHDVEVIGVTKTHLPSVIKNAYKNGIRTIGENRVQEAEKKFQSRDFPKETIKRFIGHLQSNKVRKCMDIFNSIDSIDSIKLIRKISNVASEKGKPFPVLLEINTSGEIQKNGFKKDNINEILKCFEFDYARIDGLMTIAPYTSDKSVIRACFQELRNLKEKLNNLLGEETLKELSMGMSGDYKIAVEEGSTMIRLGTLLFGKR